MNIAMKAKNIAILLSLATIAVLSYTQYAEITSLGSGDYMTICGFSGLVCASYMLLGE